MTTPRRFTTVLALLSLLHLAHTRAAGQQQTGAVEAVLAAVDTTVLLAGKRIVVVPPKQADPRVPISAVASRLGATTGAEEEYLRCPKKARLGLKECTMPDDLVLLTYEVEKFANDTAVVTVYTTASFGRSGIHISFHTAEVVRSGTGWKISRILRVGGT